MKQLLPPDEVMRRLQVVPLGAVRERWTLLRLPVFHALPLYQSTNPTTPSPGTRFVRWHSLAGSWLVCTIALDPRSDRHIFWFWSRVAILGDDGAVVAIADRDAHPSLNS